MQVNKIMFVLVFHKNFSGSFFSGLFLGNIPQVSRKPATVESLALFQWISECDFQNYQSISRTYIVVVLN